MSAVPHNGRTVLPFTPSNCQSLLKHIKELDQLEPQYVQELSSLSFEELLPYWSAAYQLIGHGWRLKCYISANIWEETAAAKRGRGNKDVGSIGILAAVSKRSKQLGVTPSTIYLNARIYRLIEQAGQNVIRGNKILNILLEKSYYEVALTAADPVAALTAFAEKKLDSRKFRPTDAERLLLTEGQTKKVAKLKAVDTVRQEGGVQQERLSLISHIAMSQEIIQTKIIPTCPDEDFKERVWAELLAELKDELQELDDQDISLALRKAWDLGHHREDGLAAHTGLPLTEVSRLMNALSDLSEFIRIQPRAMKDRGKFQLWHKVGEPFDNAMYVPQRRAE